MKKIAFCIFLCAFLLVRPYFLQSTGMCYQGDDYSYFAHASSLVFAQFPSYDKEHFTAGKTRPEHPMGPGLMAAPFIFIFSFIDRILESDIILVRTAENIPPSWSLFGFVFATSIYFWLACYLLYHGLLQHFKKSHASLTVILLVLVQGLGLFAFRRPLFPHIDELFLQSLLIFFLLKSNGSNFLKDNGYRKMLFVGIIMGLMTLVRYNNIIMALTWPVVLMGSPYSKESICQHWKKLLLAYSTFALMIIILKILPESMGFWGGFTSAKKYLFIIHTPLFYIKRFFHVFVGIDWGLLYTAPYLLIGFGFLVFSKFKLKRQLLLLLIPIAVNFFVIMQWLTQAGWYGYRYLIFSFVPILAYPTALFIKWLDQRMGRKMLIPLLVISAFPLLSTICFEGNNSNLTLSAVDQYFGRLGWGNNTYQLEVWKTLLSHPVEFLIVTAKGGPLYIIYLLALLFQAQNSLPNIVLEKYPAFDVQVLIKTLLLYAIPFILYYLSTFFSNKKPAEPQ